MSERISTARRMGLLRDRKAIIRTVNGHRKAKSRARIEIKIREMIGRGKFPYTPVVSNHVCVALGVPSSELTPEHYAEFLNPTPKVKYSAKPPAPVAAAV